jgi:hypothetical protein
LQPARCIFWWQMNVPCESITEDRNDPSKKFQVTSLTSPDGDITAQLERLRCCRAPVKTRAKCMYVSGCRTYPNYRLQSLNGDRSPGHE